MPEPEELLSGELAAVRGELSRVDAKCATLTGLAGAAAAFLTTRIHTATPLLTRLLLAAAGIGLAAAAVLLLAGVLRPRTGTTGFRRWSAMNDHQINTHFTDLDRAFDRGGIPAFDATR